MSQKKEYYKFIAYAQVIGIILVVLGHSFHEYPDGNAHGSSFIIWKLIYSFHMPLFLFISGFLMIITSQVCVNPKSAPRKFIMGKVKRLLLPMIVLTSITFAPRALMSGISDDIIELNLESFLNSFIYTSKLVIPYFWYLQAVFILLVCSFLIFYITTKLQLSPQLTAILLFVIMTIFALSNISTTDFLSLSSIKDYGMFFFLGTLYAIFFNQINKYINWSDPFLFGDLFICWLISFFLLKTTIFHFITAIIGILMIISLTTIIEKKQWSFLDHLTGANYIIFLLSWYFNVLFQQVLSHFVLLPWWIYSLLSLIAGIYIPWLGYKYLEKHQNSLWIRVTSFLLGQTFRNKKSMTMK